MSALNQICSQLVTRLLRKVLLHSWPRIGAQSRLVYEKGEKKEKEKVLHGQNYM